MQHVRKELSNVVVFSEWIVALEAKISIDLGFHMR